MSDCVWITSAGEVYGTFLAALNAIRSAYMTRVESYNKTRKAMKPKAEPSEFTIDTRYESRITRAYGEVNVVTYLMVSADVSALSPDTGNIEVLSTITRKPIHID